MKKIYLLTSVIALSTTIGCIVPVSEQHGHFHGHRSYETHTDVIVAPPVAVVVRPPVVVVRPPEVIIR
jgi:hypothetical protein